MAHRRPGFRFLLGIQEGELYSSAVERIMESAPSDFVSNFGYILKHSREHLGLCGSLVKDIGPISHLLPSVAEIIDKHSLFPLASPFMSTFASTLVRQRIENDIDLAVPLKKQYFAHFERFATQLKICPVCAEESMADTATVVWDREASVVGNLVCAKHGCAYLTACIKCGKGYSLEIFEGRPRRFCQCGGEMVSHVENDVLSIAHSLAKDVHEIFEGILDVTSYESMLTMMRQAANKNEIGERNLAGACKRLMEEAGVYDFFVKHVDSRGATSVTLQAAMTGWRFSANTMLNVVAVRAMLGPLREIRDSALANPDLFGRGDAFPESVSKASKQLLLAISKEYPNIYPGMLQKKFSDAFWGLVASENEFVSNVITGHKKREWGARRELRDDVLLRKLKERYQELLPKILRISTRSLLDGITNISVTQKRRKQKFPKSNKFIDECVEDGIEGVKARLIRFSENFPDCVNDYTENIVSERLNDVSSATLRVALRKLIEIIKEKRGI